jgi:hypothetical protein
MNINNLLILVTVLGLQSCEQPKPNEEKAREVLAQTINQESHGVVFLESFDIINEETSELFGVKSINYAYHGKIGFNSECWKNREILGSDWNTYEVMDVEPESKIMDLVRKPLHYVPGDFVDITGEIEYTKTKEGWQLD